MYHMYIIKFKMSLLAILKIKQNTIYYKIWKFSNINFFSDIEENITNLSGFNTELIIKATVKCLDIIKPGLGLSTVLPMNMAARFRLGATLAQACLVRFYEYKNFNYLQFCFFYVFIDKFFYKFFSLGIRIQSWRWLSNIFI